LGRTCGEPDETKKISTRARFRIPSGTAALVQEGGTAPGDGYSSMVNLDSEAIGIVYSAGDKILFQRQPVESL